MTLELRGEDIVLLDLPENFTLPEHFPVRWCTELKAFAVPRRHGCVPSLLKLLRERGLLDAAAADQILPRRGLNPRRSPSRPTFRTAADRSNGRFAGTGPRPTIQS